ncbi:hypothetical protein LWI29_019989 [Acer saccharum]|uniref:C2H2-type domain-containing protein n=1 Tax=Acer saccharum TaxID=4024 RepID=A0AA39RY23_ACESA|nr:hypothetical protein LWI29_019989 [Acer saccharum]
MAKKKRSSASRRKPPPSTTIDETFTPPTPAVEPVDPVKREISRALIALRSGKHEKALDFIKESISCDPLSGYLHHVEGMVHQSLAEKVEVYYDARFKQHLEDGVFSSQLAVELLPNSIHCASLLAELLYQLAFLNDEWGRVIEVCKSALKIENPTGSGIGEIFGEDVRNESRTEDEKLTVMMWLLRHAEQKNLEFAEKKAVEDSEVDINHVVMAMDRRKKQFKAVVKVCCALKKKMIDNSKKFNCDDERIVEYKRFWSGSLGDKKKKGFQKVNIEELEKHLKLLKCKLAVDHLSEAIAFAKDNQTLKFWDCYDCVKKFGNYASYRHHFGEKHRMVTTWKLASELDIGKKSVDMILDCVWKPVDTAEARKIIVNHTKSELCSTSDRELGSKKGLDECKSSSVGKVLGKISKSDRNESSKTSSADDTERAEILVRIRGIFDLLLKNNCLAKSHVRWAIEYTKDQFESTILQSQFRNHGLETPQIICCLGATQLTEVLEFLRDVACNCGLSEDAEMDNPMDDKLSGDLFVERIDFSKDYSCLLWQELQGEPDDNNFDAVGDDGSAIILPFEYEDYVFSDSYDIVSWLHVGSSCGEAFKSWTCLRDFQRGQAKKLLKMFDEELLHLHTLYDRRIKMSSKLKVVQMVGSMLVEEISKMEKSPEDQTQHFLDLLKKRLEETQEIDDISVATKVEVITNVLEDAQVVMGGGQSGSEECSVEDEWKQAENAVKIVSQRLKMQLLNDLSLLDAIVLRIIDALGQYEWDLASISVYDYRSIIVPMMKSFLQPLLKDLYEDAKEKSKAAEETLLAVMALEETDKKINKDSDNVKQKKKKKNKNPKKAKESDGTNDSKHFELHQNGAVQDIVFDVLLPLPRFSDNPNSKSNDSLGELKQLTVNDEERMLAKYLENQKQFEHEASVKVNASGSRHEKLLGDSVSIDVSENSSAIEESMLEEPSEYQRQIDNNETKQKCIAEKPKNIGETIGGIAVEGVSDFSPERLLADSVSVDVSENSSAIEERMLEEPSEYQRQIDNEAIQNCNAEKPKNIGETIGGNAEEGVSDYSSESNHEECDKRFLCDIEKAICLSLDCFEKCYGTLLPTDVNNGKTSRLDVQLYVIMQSQWYLRQIRDEFTSIVPNKTHTHAGDPCFRCAYSDTFAARRIASRDMPEEVVQLSSRKLYPVQDYFEEWLNKENPANKVIDISSSACQLKQQLVDVVRKIVVDLEHERQINNDDTQKEFAEQNTA